MEIQHKKNPLQNPTKSPSNSVSAQLVLKNQIESGMMTEEQLKELKKEMPEVTVDGKKLDLTPEQKASIKDAAKKFERLMYTINAEMPKKIQEVLDTKYSNPPLRKPDGSKLTAEYIMLNPAGFEFVLAEVGVSMRGRYANQFTELKEYDSGWLEKLAHKKYDLMNYGGKAMEELTELTQRTKGYLQQESFAEYFDTASIQNLISGGALTYVVANGWPEDMMGIGMGNKSTAGRYAVGGLTTLMLMAGPPETIVNTIETAARTVRDIVTFVPDQAWKGLQYLKGNENFAGQEAKLTTQRKTLDQNEREDLYMKDVMPVLLKTLKTGTPLHTALSKIATNKLEPNLTQEEIDMLVHIKSTGTRLTLNNVKSNRVGSSNIEDQYVIESDEDIQAMVAKAIPNELITKYMNPSQQEQFARQFATAIENRKEVVDLSAVVLSGTKPNLTEIHKLTQDVMKKVNPNWTPPQWKRSLMMETNGVEYAIQAFVSLFAGIEGYKLFDKIKDWFKGDEKAPEPEKKEVQTEKLAKQLVIIADNRNSPDERKDAMNKIWKYTKDNEVMGQKEREYLEHLTENSSVFQTDFAMQIAPRPGFLQLNLADPDVKDLKGKMDLTELTNGMREAMRGIMTEDQKTRYQKAIDEDAARAV